MSLRTRLVAHLAGLRSAVTHDIVVERDVPVPMFDNVVLLADHYFPRTGGILPIILIRTPYGRRSMELFGRLFAERGYRVIVQSTRGTFGSQGNFDPFQHEERDGLSSLHWLEAQPWYGAGIAMYGASYVGVSQFGVAGKAPNSLKALHIELASSNVRDLIYPRDTFGLDFVLAWILTMHGQDQPLLRRIWRMFRKTRLLTAAFAHVPLCQADRVMLGKRLEYFQEWLRHSHSEDPFWKATDFSLVLDQVSASVNLIAGWYDIFLLRQLVDYVTLRRAGHTAYLTIGPWTHTGGAYWAGLREAQIWFDAHLRGDYSQLRNMPVRIFVMGSRRWLELPDWPPPSTPHRWYLQPEGRLTTRLPPPSGPDAYKYDPRHPTPALGGALYGLRPGPVDNRELESRADVLTYTSSPLEDDLDVIGSVSVVLHVRSTLAHTDFFARLCDVEAGGRSLNVCDGLVRLWPGRLPQENDGTIQVLIELLPTAYTFRVGHRLRLQVSGGAHPRYCRNFGTDEPLPTASKFRVAQQSVYHDAQHPSALVLPLPSSLPGPQDSQSL